MRTSSKMKEHDIVLRMRNELATHWRVALIGASLFLITVALYLPTLTYSFVNFDDNYYITENAYVTSGLRGSNILWAFTHFHMGYWIPTTWISHMFDCQIWGTNPGPAHLVNGALHALNVGLLFLL